MRAIQLICIRQSSSEKIKENQRASLLLVHGGWHGAWSWHKIMPLLEKLHFSAVAIDLPGNGADCKSPSEVGLQDYVKKIKNIAESIVGPIILVGHSSAGTAIAQAAESLGIPKVQALIFLDAFMPKDGESVFSLVEKFADLRQASGSALGESIIVAEDGKTCTLNPGKLKDLLYHDCNEADYKFAREKLSPQPIATLATPVRLTNNIYGKIPKYYILCTQARDFDKRKLTQNMPIKKLYTIESSHSPFFSRPQELVDHLTEITNQTSK